MISLFLTDAIPTNIHAGFVGTRPVSSAKTKTIVQICFHIFIRLLLLCILGACGPLVPATTPPQLEHTPGSFVVVTDEKFDGGLFQVDYPSDWRIVKTSIAADEHIQVVLVAPDDSTVTLTLVDTANDNTNTERYIELSNNVVVQIIVAESEDAEESFQSLAEKLIASVQ